MKVFRGVVLGVTIAFFILAILSLLWISSVQMHWALTVVGIITAILNIVSTVLWWKEKRLILMEMKWAGLKLDLK